MVVSFQFRCILTFLIQLDREFLKNR
uniref:Uncharacterized protein n=1 Tax=Arundo donax TaxID=35708 RepID=A0A0A8ZKF9_ARUDO